MLVHTFYCIFGSFVYIIVSFSAKKMHEAWKTPQMCIKNRITLQLHQYESSLNFKHVQIFHVVP